MRRTQAVTKCEMFVFDGHEKNNNIDKNLMLGSWIFGMGWALSGVCPGPAIASLPGALIQGLNNGSMMLYIPFMFIGIVIFFIST